MTTRRWVSVGWMVVGLLTAGVTQAAKTNYVSEVGTNLLPPYTSWELATPNFQAAIDDTAASDTVLVSNGTYWINNEIAISNAITVKGVWGSSSTLVVRAAAGTNLPHHRIFNITGAATLDGFTARGGYLPVVLAPTNSQGGGIYMSAGTVQNCVIAGNEVAWSWQSWGGGLYMKGSSKLQGSTVVSNKCETYGGGLFGTGSALLISNTIAYNTGVGAYLNNSPKAYFCVFANNAGSGVSGYDVTLSNCVMRFNTAGSGGGFYGVNGNTLLDCTIVSNKATSQGGGVYLSGGYSPLLLRRCLIAGNTNANYPGIYMDIGFDPSITRIFELCRVTDNRGQTSVYVKGRPEYVRFRNCTISAPGQVGVDVPNLATNASGQFLYPYFVNTIVYNHATNIFSTNATVLSSILANSFSNCCSPQLTAPGYGNVAANPMFAKASAGDYRLHVSSPCVDAGITNVLSIYKGDLESVPWGSTVHMGCYKTLFIPKGTMILLN